MKHKLFLMIFLLNLLLFAGGCMSVKNSVIASEYPDESEILNRLKRYPAKPFYPPAADRQAWLGLPAELRSQLIAEAGKYAEAPWPRTTAMDYMKFRTAGSRAAYETPYLEKRKMLAALVCGECCEYSGRFIDAIIEGLWQIISEPAWCIPAHEGIPVNELFPDPGRFKIDLFSASTGRLLCDVLVLLEPELAKKSPFLVKRIKLEVMRRVIEPAEKLNARNTWWFSGRNNWTPWCASNLAGCAIYLLNDQPERLAKFLNTYLGIARRFYHRRPDDGGCDEGPSYWRHATGKYLQLLDMLDERLQLGGEFFKDEKLKKMCEYVVGMNLCGKWFLSTNDAPPKLDGSVKFFRYAGEKVNSPALKALAGRLDHKKFSFPHVVELNDVMIDLFTRIPDEPLPAAQAPVSYWKDLSIAIIREKSDCPERGTVIALKGGHNAESHNHLDLGHFSLFRCNQPLILDVGAGVYNAKTFSSERYTLWNCNSYGHNAPRFDGVGQEKDRRYHAAVTTVGDSCAVAVLDNAYPEAAGVKTARRKISLDRRNGNVELCDTVNVTSSKKIRITLHTAVEPEKISGNCVRWPSTKLLLTGLEVESIAEETRMDRQIRKNWGKLWRIELTGNIQTSGSWKMNFDFSGK